MIRQAEWLGTLAISILLLWAPLPYGSVTSWSEALLEIAAFALFALALASDEAPAALRRLRWPAGALAAIALLGAAQAFAWPRSFAQALSPGHVRLFDAARELLGGLPESSVPLSLAPSESLRTALSFVAVAAALLAAGIAGRDRRRRRALALALVASALFQVLYGARRWFARSNEIWGREVPGTSERLRGTFVNPNHLAFFLGLALPVVFAWGWWSFRRAREETQMERRLLRVAPPIIVWLLLFAGLAFTGSRAGMIAALAAVVAQGALLAAGEKTKRWFAAGLALAFAGLAVVALIGRQEGFGRLLGLGGGGAGWSVRVEAWRATLHLAGRFPLFGTGLGTFREGFPLVQPADLAGTWRQAHNDPLELLATGGAVAFALALVGLAALIVRLAGVLRHGRRSEDRAAALGALGALAAAGLHELVDFSLSLPANAFAVAVLAGAAASARRSQEAHGARKDRAAVDRDDLDQVKPGGDRERQSEGGAGRGDEGAGESAVGANLDHRAAGRHVADRDLDPAGGPRGDQLPARPPF